jgi:hypothetical protein
MHSQQPKEKFAAISVSLDDPNEKGVRETVLKFLTEQKAAFTNLILDEKAEVWQEKLQFDGPPCVFVFNQMGKVEKQFKEDFTYADVAKTVKELLATGGQE